MEQEEKEVNLEVNNEQNSNKNAKKNNNSVIIILVVIILIILIAVCTFLFMDKNNKSKEDKKDSGEISTPLKKSEYRITGNSLEKFDLYFLQLENKKVNKIYSPLSIKYALEMLEEGTSGSSKEQISNIIGEYDATKYVNNKNMSFANAIFINETYKNSIKNEYIDILSNKYNAEVVFDKFRTVDNVNSWISDKTLKLINNTLDDASDDTKFILVNALGIDMEWENKFLLMPGSGVSHNARHEKFSWHGPANVSSNKFDNTQKVSGMKVVASINNYDIVNVLGEDKIRETVGSEYRKYLADQKNYALENELKGDSSEENVNKVVNKYLDEYIKEINMNYKYVSSSTDFSIYVDDEIKAFAKDLKEYNGITLQYVGIMPNNMELEEFIDIDRVNKVISNLKELKSENFKEGVVTKIIGFIPKFKFDYELDLQGDLEKLGVTDIFDASKANLTGISSEKMVIEKALHKANIEFTQDGIKAAAVTAMSGAGAGGPFDYLYEVPVEEIDLTFDKPYMFLIRDKKTGEVWFTGTVYEPLSWDKEPETKSNN